MRHARHTSCAGCCAPCCDSAEMDHSPLPIDAARSQLSLGLWPGNSRQPPHCDPEAPEQREERDENEVHHRVRKACEPWAEDVGEGGHLDTRAASMASASMNRIS